MATIARLEGERHRRRLADALAAQLPGTDAEHIAGALAATDAWLAESHARPGARRDLNAELARRIGVGEAEVDAAFEGMSRQALALRARGPLKS